MKVVCPIFFHRLLIASRNQFNRLYSAVFNNNKERRFESVDNHFFSFIFSFTKSPLHNGKHRDRVVIILYRWRTQPIDQNGEDLCAISRGKSITDCCMLIGTNTSLSRLFSRNFGFFFFF